MTTTAGILADTDRVWRDVADARDPDDEVTWAPNPGRGGELNPQAVALKSTADELFYGGAKGGAKTDTLLAKPLYQVHKPLYAGAFVRQTYTELQRPLDRAHRIYGAMPPHLRPAWSGELHRFTWPSRAFLQFGYTAKSLEWTQGGNWAEVLWDEMANEPDERKVDTLVSEIRCPDPTVIRQLASSGNPGFAGHPWVKRRYIIPCGRNGQTIAFSRVQLPDGRWIPRSKQYVPARITDNPTYANDDVYLAALAQLPERMQRCLLLGDWDAATGLAFDEIDASVHLIPPFAIPAHWPYSAGFDWGFVHNAVFLHARTSEDGRIVVVDTIYRRLLRDWDLAGVYEELVPLGARINVQAGTDVKSEIKARADQQSTMDTFSQRGIHLVIGNTSRVFGYQNLLAYLAWKPTDYAPVRQPLLQFFDTPGNRRLLQELEAMVNNPDDPRDVLKVNADTETGEGGDDGYDALRVLCAGRPLVAKSGYDEIPVNAFDPGMLRAAAERAAKASPLPRRKSRTPLFY
jgi:hypothetical protein